MKMRIYKMRYKEFKKIQNRVTDETIFVMENTPVPMFITKHTFGVFSTKVFLPKNLGEIPLGAFLLASSQNDVYSLFNLFLKINRSEDGYNRDKYSLQLLRKKQTQESIAEAYHKAKADGSNPELVKAVEELLGQKQSPSVQVGEAVVESEQAIEALNHSIVTGKQIGRAHV